MLKLSSVIGAPFRPFVRRQLVARVAHGKTGGGLLSGATYGNDLLRTSEDVQYLANQVAWIKLSSSVQPTGSYIQYLKDQFADSGDSDAFLDDQWTSTELARNWVLQGGTSKDQNTLGFAQSILAGTADNFQGRRTETVLREGTGPDGAYGLGGTVGQGYRPMPGITSMKVQTAGRGGSLRYATVEFKVWNRNQLDIIDTLYLRLGYTMLLEWGHAQYYETAESVELIRDNYGTDKFFLENANKDVVQYDITRRVIDSNGNYDGMLGLVTNFDCSFNQEGGWDCSIKLIGLGSIMESQKINLAYTMPPSIQAAWEGYVKRYEAQRRKEKNEAYDREDRAARNAYGGMIARSQQDWDNQHPIRDQKTLAESIGEHTKAKKDTDADLKNILTTAKVTTLGGASLDTEFYYFENPTPTSTNTNVNETVLYKGQIPPTVEPTTATLPTLLPIKAGTEFTYNFAILDATLAANVAGISLPVGTPVPSGIAANQQLVSSRLNYYRNSTAYKAPPGVKDIVDLALGKSGTTQLVLAGLLDTWNQTNLSSATSTNIDGFKPRSGNTNYQYAYQVYGNKSFFQSPGLIIEVDGTAGFNLDDIRQKGIISFYQRSGNGVAYRTRLSIIGTTQQTGKALPFSNTFLQIWSGYKDDDDYYVGIKGADFVNFLESQIANIGAFKVNDQDGITYTTETSNGVFYKKAVIKATQSGTFAVQPITLYSNPTFLDRFKGVTDFNVLFQRIARLNRPQKTQSTTIDLGLVFQLETEILTPITVTGQETARPTYGSGGGPTSVTRNYDDIKVELANMSLGLGSALEAMLTVIKYDSITNYKSGLVYKRSLVDLTGKFLNYGTESLPPMAPLFKQDPTSGVYELNVVGSNTNELASYPFLSTMSDEELLTDATSLGVKGYSTALLQDYNKQPASNPPISSLTPKQRWEAVPSLDFDPLFSSYLLSKHILSSALDKPNYKNEYPVYITLGYLLFFINNQSLLYDTTRASKASPGTNISRPLFYIDYHNETNLCSVTPNQLTVNPEIVLTRYNGSLSDYKNLFPQNVTPSDPYFLESKNQNTVSNLLPQFKLGANNHGRTMNILLNVDYLLSLIKSTVDRDKHNNVYLQAFLENIVADINKSLGDVNAFRVGYNDAGNTVQITDDQAVAPLGVEEDHLFTLTEKLLSKGKQLFEFPVFEVGSLARSFTLQTDTSTRMSRAIAIGAQAANNGAVQSVDASAYHWLNTGLSDRMIVTKQNATQPSAPSSPLPASGQTGNKKKSKNNKKNNKKNASSKAISPTAQEDPNKILATKFNNHIINIYTTPTSNKNQNIFRENIDTARNFLIQGATKAKADAENTYGSLSIPYNATITIPGISGIIMGNAFLLPDKILPLSVRGTTEISKFGFYVMGLDHSLDSNQWVTSIKGQMVRIREPRKRDNTPAGNGVATGTPVSSRSTGGLETSFKASNVGNGFLARQAVEDYFGAPILDAEWDEVVALVFAEGGNRQEQRGSILAVILNIARRKRESITDSIRQATYNSNGKFVGGRYQPVTGLDGKTSTTKFKTGPDQTSEELIYLAAINVLPGVDKALNGFTAYDVNAYGKPGTRAGIKNKTRKAYLLLVDKGAGYKLYSTPEDPAKIKDETQEGIIFVKQ